MDARTEEALRASIKHWEENVAADCIDAVSVMSDNCALCQMFCDRYGSCEGCPVADRTEEDSCQGSPWGAAYDALHKWKYGKGSHKGFRKAAQAELDFLKSLLPTDEPAKAEG